MPDGTALLSYLKGLKSKKQNDKKLLLGTWDDTVTDQFITGTSCTHVAHSDPSGRGLLSARAVLPRHEQRRQNPPPWA